MEATTIVVKIVDQNQDAKQFRIRTSAPLKKLFASYAEMHNLDLNSVRFYVDGERLKDDDTPQSSGLTDQTMIEVFSQQSGGDVEAEGCGCLPV